MGFMSSLTTIDLSHNLLTGYSGVPSQMGQISGIFQGLPVSAVTVDFSVYF
jgi:hypothetical protein